MSEPKKTQLAVIGAGPGGYAAAFHAADLGLKVTLIDLDANPGGVCLYRGCIPSKALLHCAKVLTDAREAKHWGIYFNEPTIDLFKMRASKDEVVAHMTGGLGQLVRARKIDFIRGRASFEESNTLRITKEEGGEEYLTCEHAILAAGSRPATLPQVLTESPRIMNSTAALQIESIPKTLLVVGGGYIGLELGSVYAALGSKVTVVELAPQLLPGADADLVEVLAKRMQSIFHEILLQTRMTTLEDDGEGVKVVLESTDGSKRIERFDKVLVSIGRKPNSSGLNLHATKVQVDEKGFVKVDEQRRTDDSFIFAIGDIVGEPMLAHKASHEGRVAAEVIAGGKAVFDPQAIPAVVFTDPELAWTGLTENQARKSGIPVEVAKFPWTASGRASTLHRTDGLTKILSEPGTGRILGVGIVGAGAGELIAQGTLAIEMGATAEDVQLTIHPHPTLSETVMETAELIFGHGTHVFKPTKK
ncbi:MAG TPA: dihydrolipoyl dehydrogenase [Candidatus Hydrogenedentes bacterium]|nr:dihydrolipoyl dehydrogenase [Candidatus Hydrogenedentota bacterium]HOL76976.1 dihydrolipoyl dehydrogenase [Candidatus Hydrogenedentota bacterium]HPO86634.1 dihydrolipoyl dehydrogenase [Candidatus Hydrogenedentota bacterium]